MADLIDALILCFAVFSAIRFLSRFMSGLRRGQPRTNAGAKARAAAGDPATTVLHQDPVCGTYVAANSSLRKICGGKVFHFCSEECRDRYVA